MRPRRIARALLNAVSRRMSFDTAMLVAKQLMHDQGFGEPAV